MPETPAAAAADADADADARWRAWQARGVESDRQRARNMRRVTVLAALALALWSFIQLS
jgi:hypothetical protein